MRRYMIVIRPLLSGYGTVLHVAVSLPYVEALMDGKKYLEPDNVPKQPSRDLRRLRQTPRAPSLRTIVRLARQCDSAEELGLELRRRYQRKQNAREAAEIDARIDRLLAQD